MSIGSDRRYYEERLARNRALAQTSRDPAIRNIHLGYARLYEQMLVIGSGYTFAAC